MKDLTPLLYFQKDIFYTLARPPGLSNKRFRLWFVPHTI